MNVIFLLMLLVVGGYSACKKWGVFNKALGIAFGGFVIACIFWPLVQASNTEKLGIPINWNFLILNSLVLMVLGSVCYSIGYGAITLVRKLKTQNSETIESSKETENLVPTVSNSSVVFTNSDGRQSGLSSKPLAEKTTKLGVNSPFRRVFLIIFLLSIIFGVGYSCFYYFDRMWWIQSPYVLYSQDEAKIFCQRVEKHPSLYAYKPSFDECIELYPYRDIRHRDVIESIKSSEKTLERLKQEENMLNPEDLEESISKALGLKPKKKSANYALRKKQVKEARERQYEWAYESIKGNEGKKDYFYGMVHFHETWLESHDYWKTLVIYSLPYLVFLILLFFFAYGIGQRALKCFATGLVFCLIPFKKIWHWIKTGK